MPRHRAALIVMALLGVAGLAALFFGTTRGSGGSSAVAVLDVRDAATGERASLDLVQPASPAATSATTAPDAERTDPQPAAQQPTGGPLIAHLVNESGDPLAGVRVRFTRSTPGARPSYRPAPSIEVVTDANGRLAAERTVACGPWSYEVPAHLTLLGDAHRLEVIAGGSLPHTITVREPDAQRVLAGRVVDRDSWPVEGALVIAIDLDGNDLGRATTDADGAFHVVRGGGLRATLGGPPTRLVVRGAEGFDNLEDAELHAWGADNVVLRLLASSALLVTVVAGDPEGDTEGPIEEFSVSWFGGPSETAVLPGAVGPPETFPGGTALVRHVPTGPIRIIVAPADHALAPNVPIEFIHASRATDGATLSEVRVELPQRQRVRVRVYFEDGRPAVGTKVDLLAAPEPEGAELDTYGLDPVRHAQLVDRRTRALLCDTATTDARGEVLVGWRRTAARLDVRLAGPQHLPHIERWSSAAMEGDTLDITVRAGATWGGVVRPLSVLDDLADGQLGRGPGTHGPTIILTYTGDARWRGSHARRSCRIDESGAFTLTGLQPGAWTVQLSNVGVGAGRSTKSFTAIEVVGDGVYSVVLDVADLAPATLTGHVVWNGAALAERTVHLLRVELDSDGHTNRAGETAVITDAAGRFVATGLRPGRYHASIDGPECALIAPVAIGLAPGARATETLRIDSGELLVSLTTEAGEPAGGRTIEITDTGRSFRTTLRTDDDGQARCTQIATGRYVLHMTGTAEGAPRRRLGEITVTAGRVATAAPFVVSD